jgi:hypothetical protein
VKEKLPNMADYLAILSKLREIDDPTHLVTEADDLLLDLLEGGAFAKASSNARRNLRLVHWFLQKSLGDKRWATLPKPARKKPEVPRTSIQ